MKFEIGQRVQQSDRWMSGSGSRQKARQHGVVVGYGRNSYEQGAWQRIRVHIDGHARSSITTWHGDFWEQEREPIASAGQEE